MYICTGMESSEIGSTCPLLLTRNADIYTLVHMRIEQMTFKAATEAVERGEFPRRRRVVLDLDWRDYWTLKSTADEEGMTISNFIRRQCELPVERQGVKRPDPPKVRKSRPV